MVPKLGLDAVSLSVFVGWTMLTLGKASTTGSQADIPYLSIWNGVWFALPYRQTVGES